MDRVAGGDDQPDAGNAESATPPGVGLRSHRATRHPLRRLFGGLWAALGWLLVAVGAVLIGTALWIRRIFGPVSVDQLLMHIPGAGGAEAEATPEGYVSSFIVEAIMLPILATAVLLVTSAVLRRWWTRHGTVSRGAGTMTEKIIRRSGVRFWGRPILAVTACIAGGAVFAQAIQAPQFVQSIATDLTLEDYYVVPSISDGQHLAGAGSADVGDQKNLVMIYLESIEDSFADEALMGENLLEPVQRATEGWAEIPHLRQYEGGGWTMAGIIGQQCGIPLRGASLNPAERNDIGEGQEDYLPGAVCLGDVLADAGYTSVFMGGAHKEFASKGTFLSNHGYDVIKDANHWIEQGETEYSVWGLSDGRLMENAKAEVDELHASGEPFNLTVLTLDSHEPAHIFDYCTQTTEEPLASATRCSMEQVAGFVQHMSDRGYLEDTVVMLVGDHLKMVGENRPFWDELGTLEGRTVFNRIWSPESIEISRSADQLSLYATVLDLLDLGRADHRAGVGASLLVERPPDGSPLDLSPEDYEELINSRSFDFYQRLWGTEEESRAAEAPSSERGATAQQP